MAKKDKKQNTFLFEEILDIFKHNASKQLNYRQVSAMAEITDEPGRLAVMEVLEALSEKGLIEQKESGKFQFKMAERSITGRIDFTTSGSAYVITSEVGEDIFIQKGRTMDALNGDTVKVLVSSFPGRKKEGIITQVIERKKTDFVGTAQVGPKNIFVIPDNHKLHVDFFIPREKSKNIKDGQKALIKLLKWNTAEPSPIAEVVEVLGYPGSHTTEMHAIMAEYGLPDHFPDSIEAAAKGISTKITEEEIKKRRDFRDILTFTIDPHDAKDFDDALSFRKLENGNMEVGVHIADVTHYVKPQSIIDEEGLQRATSVYLVDRVIPMLPEILSNFVCSLRPKEEKLCFAAVFELDEEANVKNEWFGRTVIYSDRRFAYEEVQEIIETKKGDHVNEILVLDSLAKKLRDHRSKNGSIFFDKEEVKFHLDDMGKPTGVYFKVQLDAHKLIEDFMLLANKQVATLLGKKPKNSHQKNPPTVYRVHDSPSNDKLSDLSTFVGKFGYSMDTANKKTVTQSINKLLQEVKGKPEQGTIEILAIRSMPKAIYTTKNIGHYGLGFDFYTHFTSPIRRYPDMLVHRLLEAYLNGKKYSNEEELEQFCKHSSDQEKMAADAERASIKYKQVEFLQDKIGQIYMGVISGVTEWGMYIEIIENKCEGMVRPRDMKDDFYSFDEDNYRYVGKRTGNTYRLGDKVMIEVKDADMLKKQLTFVIVDTAEKNPDRKQEDRHSKHSKDSHKSSHRGSNKGSHKGKKRRR
ncbi:MAG TPA: ribonuclease R [Bacteroidia bacterium]|jgi:ribonuclease R|nr:ribonuclease R [Bacteroidia bacterium]